MSILPRHARAREMPIDELKLAVLAGAVALELDARRRGTNPDVGAPHAHGDRGATRAGPPPAVDRARSSGGGDHRSHASGHARTGAGANPCENLIEPPSRAMKLRWRLIAWYALAVLSFWAALVIMYLTQK